MQQTPHKGMHIPFPAHPRDVPGVRQRRPEDRAFDWLGQQVEDLYGRGIGVLTAVLVDRLSGAPQWLEIAVGRAGHRYCAPLARAASGNGRVWIPFERRVVLSSSRVSAEHGRLSARVERRLWDLYGQPATRGARLSRWERRATSARAWIDPRTGDVMLLPGTRGDGDDRRQGGDRSGTARDGDRRDGSTQPPRGARTASPAPGPR